MDNPFASAIAAEGAGPITQPRLKELLNYEPDTGLFTWKVRVSNRIKVGDVAGTLDKYGYVQACVDSKLYRAHRLVFVYMTGAAPLGEVDHINGKYDDNRWVNLRDVSGEVNHQNRRVAQSNNVTGFLGVSPKRNKFRARITVGGKVVRLGHFATPEEAHAAYLTAKRELHEGCTI